MKARNIEIGKEVKVEVIAKYADNKSEVKIVEGVHAGRYAIVSDEDLVKPVKRTVKATFTKYVGENDRALNLELSCDSFDTMEIVKNYINENKENYDVDFIFYDSEYEEDEKVIDVITIDFEYGKMTNAKKEIKALMKEVKTFIK